MLSRTGIVWGMVIGIMIVGAAKADVREEALKVYEAPPAPKAADWPAERLAGFMKALTDFTYEHHVVTDSERAVYGMTYEFWRDGKQIQVFSLDAMHDGAWFTGSMACAHRARPSGPYLEQMQTYQVPFYVNVISNSDSLFAKRQIPRGDKKPIEEPLKGWVPRGWDDGLGYDKGTGNLFSGEFDHAQHEETTFVYNEDGSLRYTYFSPSNHLAQDLADGLLNVWLTTRDPAAARAVKHVRDYRHEYFGYIEPIEVAYGITNGVREAYDLDQPEFRPETMYPFYTGMYQRKGHSLTSYDDGFAWGYRGMVARKVKHDIDLDDFVLYAAGRCYGHSMALEMYWDDRPYPYGMYFFDLQVQPKFTPEGKLDMYVSNSGKIFGARGVQISWVAAGILPHFKKHAYLWERYYHQHHGNDTLARMFDDPPVTDGVLDRQYGDGQMMMKNDTLVWAASDPKNLHLFVQSSEPEVRLTFDQADAMAAEGKAGIIIIDDAGNVTGENEAGEALLLASAFKDGEMWRAEVRVPYSIVPGQGSWINGVDHGRYEVTINGATEMMYILSRPERIVRRLENLALGSIDTWHGVWEQIGVIPSGWRSPGATVKAWELSDAGNIAAVVQDIALWMIYQDGTTEWDVIKAQAPKEPLESKDMPKSVLKAQGLL